MHLLSWFDHQALLVIFAFTVVFVFLAILIGIRMGANMKQPAEGEGSIGSIVGARGKFTFHADNTWFVPDYLDVGMGDSDLTWQAIAGLGCKFHWGETLDAWRYLEYDLDSGSAIADINVNGPAIGVIFR